MSQLNPKLLQKFINRELSNSELYRILAKSAPDEQARNILHDISHDEKRLADLFISIYKSMTGYNFEPSPPPVRDKGSFRSIIKDRVLDEINNSNEYMREYMNTSDNFRLKRAFFQAYNDDMNHASKLLLILI